MVAYVFPSSAITGSTISSWEMEHTNCLAMVWWSLAQMSVMDRRNLPFMHPGRADVIGGGALILDRLLELISFSTDQMVVSEHDILDGIVWGAAAVQ